MPPACWSTFWKSILNTSWAVGKHDGGCSVVHRGVLWCVRVHIKCLLLVETWLMYSTLKCRSEPHTYVGDDIEPGGFGMWIPLNFDL